MYLLVLLLLLAGAGGGAAAVVVVAAVVDAAVVVVVTQLCSCSSRSRRWQTVPLSPPQVWERTTLRIESAGLVEILGHPSPAQSFSTRHSLVQPRLQSQLKHPTLEPQAVHASPPNPKNGPEP